QEYEVIPHQLLRDLREDVEALKNKLTKPDAKMNELILEIESLKDSIHDLHSVFQKALGEMNDEGDVTKVLPVMKEQLAAVVKQNETIATGMIAIADKVDDFIAKNSGSSMMKPKPMMSKPMPGSSPMGKPMSSPGMPSMGMGHGPSRIAPPPQMPKMEAEPQMDLPPPPPGMKKKGLF
ncbi:TPA: hypothetical protein HA278_01370, partial [Candidatus Woesearchaeota archaeon]|nr:hypothetical protein [Candidatus Woesearchaeota archaeon]